MSILPNESYKLLPSRVRKSRSRVSSYASTFTSPISIPPNHSSSTHLQFSQSEAVPLVIQLIVSRIWLTAIRLLPIYGPTRSGNGSNESHFVVDAGQLAGNCLKMQLKHHQALTEHVGRSQLEQP